MKFVIDSKNFKNVASRALAVNGNQIYLNADKKNNRLTVGSFRSFQEEESAALVWTDANIVESGKVCIDFDIIKKITKMKGMMTFTFEENSDDTMRVSSETKTVEFPAVKYEKFPISFRSGELIATCERDSMMDIFNRMSCCLSTKKTRMALTGYKLDGKNGGRIIACDNYKICMRHVDWGIPKDTNVIVPGFAPLEFNNVSKKSEKTQIWGDEKRLSFEGVAENVSFRYIVKKIEEVFPDLEKFFNKEEQMGLEIDTKKLASTLSEYKDMITIVINGRNAYVVSLDAKFKTAEKITANTESDIECVRTFNSKYLRSICEIHNEERTHVGIVGGKYPVWIFKGNGYLSVLLPVISTKETEEKDALEFVNNLEKSQKSS